MQALDFLATVLPPAGHGFYCVAELGARKQHVFDESLEAVLSAATRFDGSGLDSYFAVSTFKASGSRTADNAAFIKSFFVDIDCGPSKAAAGKGYATQREAVTALYAMLQATPLGALGTPWVVSSGGGLHVYWALDEAVTIRQWKPVAERLKVLCESNGLLCDYGLSANAACVLRPPETHNHKLKDNPRPVKIKITGKPMTVSFDAFSQAVGNYAPARPVISAVQDEIDSLFGAIEGVAVKSSAPNINLAGIGLQSRFKRILIASQEGKGCEQLRYYVERAQDDGLEPLWRGVLSIAKHTVEGTKAAERMSALHPYDETRMHQKLRDIKGPYHCSTFDSQNPGICPSCPNFGKITSPIVLGNEVKDSPIEAVSAPAPEPTPAAAELPDIEPPNPEAPTYPVLVETPYLPHFAKVTGDGVFIERKADKPGDPDPPPLRLCSLPFYLVGLYDDGENGVQSYWVMHTRAGKRDLLIPMNKLVGRDDTTKTLAEHGILSTASRDAELRLYVRSCIEMAMGGRNGILPKSLGWQKDDSFAYNGYVYSAAGRKPVPMPSLENLNISTTKQGTMEEWQMVWRLFVHLKRFDIVTLGMVGFGSTLMHFTGFSGCTFHACANGSGTGKTMSLKLASSVWGNPRAFMVTPDTSSVATINRLGFLGSLPLISDEITHKSRTTAEWFPEFLSRMSEGKGKDRMQATTNAERRNTTAWSTLALMSSNKHMVDYLTAERKHQSEGEIRRLLEIPMDSLLHLDPAERNLVGSIEHNFGHAGERWVTWLVENQEVARQVVKEMQNVLYDRFSASSDERFWIAACACVAAAVRLVGPEFANILDVPAKQVIDTLHGIVQHMRGEMIKTQRSAKDVLNDYVRDHNGHFVVVRKIDASKASPLFRGLQVDELLPRQEIKGRVVLGAVAGHTIFYVEERTLKAYCSSVSYGYKAFQDDLGKIYAVSRHSCDMLSGSKAPPLRVVALRVMMPIGDAEEVLNEEQLPDAPDD